MVSRCDADAGKRKVRVAALASTLAALATGIVLAAPAHADPGTATDDQFLAALKQAGITYRDPHQAVAAGEAVCGLMDDGTSGIDVISDVKKSNPGFSLDSAATFTAIAANEYCPQHLEHAKG